MADGDPPPRRTYDPSQVTFSFKDPVTGEDVVLDVEGQVSPRMIEGHEAPPCVAARGTGSVTMTLLATGENQGLLSEAATQARARAAAPWLSAAPGQILRDTQAMRAAMLAGADIQRPNTLLLPSAAFDAAENAFLARQLEFIRPGLMEIQYPSLQSRAWSFGTPDPGTRESPRRRTHEKSAGCVWSYFPSIHRTRPMRLHGMELTRFQLGRLADRHATQAPGRASNRHDIRRWLHRFAPVVSVADDALQEGRRGRAIAILCSMVTMEEAIGLAAEQKLTDWLTFSTSQAPAPPLAARRWISSAAAGGLAYLQVGVVTPEEIRQSRFNLTPGDGDD